LNVTSCAYALTAVHWLVEGHATLVKGFLLPSTFWSTSTGLGVPVTFGLNVTSCPLLSTAVHWLVDGQATPLKPPPPPAGMSSIVAGTGFPGDVGLNVTSWLPRVPPTAVH
jgi:hypothetical protein